MPMPPNSSGNTDRWWSDFHRDHGKDSEAEKGFLGYLSVRSMHPFSLSPTQLDAALQAFEAYVATSAEPARVEPPPEVPPARTPAPYPHGRRRFS
jgi:hypothetical protein